MTKFIKQHHGRVVDTVGDNLLAEFASAVDAVQGAVAVQKEIKASNAQLPENRKMIFRVGINLGDLVVEGDRIYGDGVNIAARLEALADPGGICISKTIHEQIEDKLPLGYEYLGEKTVKNIVKPIRAYRVLFDPEKETPSLYEAARSRYRKLHDKIKVLTKERQANPEEIDKLSEGEQLEKRPLHKNKDSNRLQKHLLTYVGVIGFLFILNMLTWHGIVWFQWPALIWGLMQWIVWIKGYNGESRRKP
jgi:adenylate cyclase